MSVIVIGRLPVFLPLQLMSCLPLQQLGATRAFGTRVSGKAGARSYSLLTRSSLGGTAVHWNNATLEQRRFGLEKSESDESELEDEDTDNNVVGSRYANREEQ